MHVGRLDPVDCHAGDIAKLALSRPMYTTVEEVVMVLDAAVRYRNEERAPRGETSNDAA